MKCLYGSKGRVALVEFYIFAKVKKHLPSLLHPVTPSEVPRSFFLSIYLPCSSQPMAMGPRPAVEGSGKLSEPTLAFQSL